MTQIFTILLPGLFTGGFIGFVVAGLIFRGKSEAISQKRQDEEQLEALAASRAEPEIKRAVRFMN